MNYTESAKIWSQVSSLEEFYYGVDYKRLLVNDESLNRINYTTYL